MVSHISSASVQPIQTAAAAAPVSSTPSSSTGTASASSASSAPSFGPAVILHLTNTSAGDAAQGDPDHDGH